MRTPQARCCPRWCGTKKTAALDALFFHLYGLNADDAAHILETFPIVREQDEKQFGRYRTRDDILARLKTLAAGEAA